MFGCNVIVWVGLTLVKSRVFNAGDISFGFLVECCFELGWVVELLCQGLGEAVSVSGVVGSPSVWGWWAWMNNIVGLVPWSHMQSGESRLNQSVCLQSLGI